MTQAPTVETWAVMTGNFGRERVLASGLSREEAERVREELRWSPLTRGTFTFLEREQPAPQSEPAVEPTPEPVAVEPVQPVARKRAPLTVGELQERRVTRAAREMDDYTVTPYNPGQWVVEGPRGCYLTSRTGCSCDDFTWRCSKAGIPCKHMTFVGMRLLTEGVLPVPAKPQPTLTRDECAVATF